jgi:hypothetical protein
LKQSLNFKIEIYYNFSYENLVKLLNKNYKSHLGENLLYENSPDLKILFYILKLYKTTNKIFKTDEVKKERFNFYKDCINFINQEGKGLQDFIDNPALKEEDTNENSYLKLGNNISFRNVYFYLVKSSVKYITFINTENSEYFETYYNFLKVEDIKEFFNRAKNVLNKEKKILLKYLQKKYFIDKY